MKRNHVLLLILLLCGLTSVKAGVSQEISLTQVIIYQPQDGPDWDRGADPCFTCFAASLSDNLLNVFNRSGEDAIVVITNLSTQNTVLSANFTDEIEQFLPVGNYQIEIFSESYIPMEGFFQIED